VASSRSNPPVASSRSNREPGAEPDADLAIHKQHLELTTETAIHEIKDGVAALGPQRSSFCIPLGQGGPGGLDSRSAVNLTQPARAGLGPEIASIPRAFNYKTRSGQQTPGQQNQRAIGAASRASGPEPEPQVRAAKLNSGPKPAAHSAAGRSDLLTNEKARLSPARFLRAVVLISVSYRAPVPFRDGASAPAASFRPSP
jgi:hypothetical protein